jgi:hypothetical protein
MLALREIVADRGLVTPYWERDATPGAAEALSR